MTVHPEVSLQALHFNEPLLEFGFKQTTPHPKDGLFLYGPHSKAKKTREVRIGVIGTPLGIGHFRDWVKRLKGHINVPPPGRGDKQDRLHLANFPGLEEAFGISLNETEFAAYPLDLKAIDQARRSCFVMATIPSCEEQLSYWTKGTRIFGRTATSRNLTLISALKRPIHFLSPRFAASWQCHRSRQSWATSWGSQKSTTIRAITMTDYL
jgi:hypothetical protein